MLENIIVTNLKRIPIDGGAVAHMLKCDETSFLGFGEIYTSAVQPRFIKAWKLHKRMTMNLIVVQGLVKFVFYDDLKKVFRKEIIGESRYARITTPPNIWFGFEGISSIESLVINISNIPHSESEVERKNLDQIKYDWTKT